MARRNDKGECSRLKDLPFALVCQGCAVNNPQGKPPLSVFLCGIEKNKKPEVEVIGEALEKWMPNLKVSSLASPIVVGLSTVHAARSSGMPPPCKTSPPKSRVPTTTYDTRDGSTRGVKPSDPIIMPSKKKPFFVMQRLNIGGEEVLTFYDSGANIHLVEGRFLSCSG